MTFFLRRGFYTNVAAMAPPSGFVPPPPIGDWSLDFINEVYTLNGAPVALADIIAKPERVGANGLEILDNDTDGSVSIIGALLTDLITAAWTVVIEFEKVAIGTLAELLFVGGDDHHSIYLDVYTSMQAGDT
ncbi:hypothetical protein, partial [Mesorhizobium sp.]|uniref:hypothetical protein n=1 Tax=Mesorhizobium sp. TaxID=1871066 RepID=UPI00260B3591